MRIQAGSITLFAVAAIILLAVPGGATAAPPTPAITTPTPYPTPTPSPVPFYERNALAPNGGGGWLTFMPLIAQGAGGPTLDVNPEAFTYVVQPGDTLWSLALDFGRDLDTMSCTTTPLGSDAETLTPGETITVPALGDLCYTVTPTDTLERIAARYGLSVDSVVGVPWNGLSGPPYTVRPRQRVLLPGVKPAARPRPNRHTVSVADDEWSATVYANWPYGDGKFVWPVEGPISQGAHRGHTALDIAVLAGTPVKAANRGTVIAAGWSSAGYGFRVIIDHGIDYVTLYAHLSDIYVEVGQIVAKGQVIGASGANGNVTGPHLHFEIRDFGRLVDPLSLLPR